VSGNCFLHSQGMVGQMLMVGIYARVSTDEQVGPEGSIVNQVQRCEKYLELKYGHDQAPSYMIRKRYREEGRSGKDIAGRPVFQQLLQDAQNGTIQAICISELSRLSRSVKDIATVLSEFDHQGIQFVCLNPQVDSSTPSGKLVLNVMAALAEYEREQTVVRTTAAMYDRAERGLWNGGHILGYDLIPEKRGYLEVNEQEAVIVRTIFETYLQLRSIGRTAEKVNALGFTTSGYTSRREKRHQAREFTYSSIHTILTNRAYRGEKEVNKGNRGKDEQSLPPQKRYQVVDAVWPAIIDAETFERVQQTLEANTQRKGRVEGKHIFLFSGLVHCAECGLDLTNGSGRSRTGKYHYYYTHPAKKMKGQKCRVPSLPAAEFEQAIMEKIAEVADNAALVNKACETANETRDEGAEDIRAQLELLRQNKQEQDSRLDSLLNALTSEERDRGPVREKLHRVSDSIEQLEQEIAEKQAELEELERSNADPERLTANLKSFRELYESLNAGDRQPLMAMMVRQIRVAPTRLELELYDHPTVIEEWDDGPDGWFRTSLRWLPTPGSYGTILLACAFSFLWASEGVYGAEWGLWGEEADRWLKPGFAVGRRRGMLCTKMSRHQWDHGGVGALAWISSSSFTT